MRAFETEKTEIAEVDRSVYDIKDKVNAAFEVNSGLTAEIVEKISEEKHDPEWMREFRLKALDTYNRMSLPTWGPSLEGLDMSNIVTYVRPNTEMRGKWSAVSGQPAGRAFESGRRGCAVRLRGRLPQCKRGSCRARCYLHRYGERTDRPLR